MESNALKESMNNGVPSKLFTRTPMIRWMLWIDFSEAVLIIPKNVLDFWSVLIENQNISNLNCYSSKSYVFVVPNDSEIGFLEEREDAAFFFLFHRYVLFIHSVA